MTVFQIVLSSILVYASQAFLPSPHPKLIEQHHRQWHNAPASNWNSFDPLVHDTKSSSTTSLSLSSTQGDLSKDAEGLTIEKISSILEITFIESCLQIATGYVDVLKMFLATVRAAYEMNLSIPELVENIEMMDVKNNSANRQLMPEEIKLRTLWIDVSYLTLECLDMMEGEKDSDNNNEVESSSVTVDTRETYESIIQDKVLQFLGKKEENTSSKTDLHTSDPVQAALMKYSLKIIDMTLVVVKEARAAGESYGIDEDGVGPPRPPIPGAFD